MSITNNSINISGNIVLFDSKRIKRRKKLKTRNYTIKLVLG
jgi:hypothetical protein